VGEELTLTEIEKILESYKDTAVEGFYVTGHMLDDKLDEQGSTFEYVQGLVDNFSASIATKKIETNYVVVPENKGYHHKISLKAIGAGGDAAHDITINYFVIDTAAEEAEKEKLQELLDENDPMVFESEHAEHGILDARVVDKQGFAANIGAMFGYVISGFDKDYARLCGVRCAALAEKVFGKKKE